MAWRLCAWSGPVFLVGLLVSFALIAGFVPPPREHWGAPEVARYYADHEVRIRIGAEGLILFAFFYLFWSMAIARVMKHADRPGSPLPQIQLFGGLSTAWVTTATGIAWLLASFRAGHRDPGDVQMFSDAGWMVFNMTAMPTFFQVVAFGVAWLSREREQLIPRWVGYLSLWVALSFLTVFVMPSLQHGPMAWHGLITFYVVLSLFFVWMIIVSRYTVRAIRALEVAR